VPGRVAAFKGWRKSPYDLLTQVYTGARMSDMFPNYVSINPADDHTLYPWESDLFPPIDKDGDSIMVVPPVPAGGGIPPGAPPVLPGASVPPIAAPAAVHPNAALLATALQATQGAGGAAPAAAPAGCSCGLLLQAQLQSIPLNSNRHSLQHTINSQPRFRT
jgi:hypothetical protein